MILRFVTVLAITAASITIANPASAGGSGGAEPTCAAANSSGLLVRSSQEARALVWALDVTVADGTINWAVQPGYGVTQVSIDGRLSNQFSTGSTKLTGQQVISICAVPQTPAPQGDGPTGPRPTIPAGARYKTLRVLGLKLCDVGHGLGETSRSQRSYTRAMYAYEAEVTKLTQTGSAQLRSRADDLPLAWQLGCS